ncbi:hypothetical protein [Companilactobacillus baiquanensis]|uniref:DUF2951 family protein n=1 Tax=Companilactobacillus baiquanensis TaxID=2486005 RepID=A0ABW1UZY7_9LACO|nr:hypothetical protein [Companilactobacillus baiquanensis]
MKKEPIAKKLLKKLNLHISDDLKNVNTSNFNFNYLDGRLNYQEQKQDYLGSRLIDQQMDISKMQREQNSLKNKIKKLKSENKELKRRFTTQSIILGIWLMLIIVEIISKYLF